MGIRTTCSLGEKSMLIFDDYKLSLKNEKTRKDYYYTINSFCKFCGKDYLETSYQDFRAYFDSLNTAAAMGNVSYKTICLKYAVLINFSAYISAHHATYGIEKFINHMPKIEKPEISININPQSIPTIAQLDRIYDASKEDTQMYCIIALVNKCALTVDQICKLKIQNFVIDSENNCGIMFPYQYSTDRKIKLPNDVLDILNEYVNNVRGQVSSEYLFLNQKDFPLTKRLLENRIKKIMIKAAGEETWNFSLQDLRNMAAILMLKSGVNDEDVASYIGIKSKWMQRYEKAVDAFKVAPCDYINISIKSPNAR